MDNNAKAAFLKEQNVWEGKRKTRDQKEYEYVGYDKMNDAGKMVYSTELLAWKKSVYVTCNDDPTSNACVTANKIREVRIKAKNAAIKDGGNVKNGEKPAKDVPKRYWDLNEKERNTFNDN
jgi:Zn-finger domain-containing protein